MSLNQLAMYNFFITQIDWDEDHPNHGLLLPNDNMMAQSLKLSYATIHKHRKELTEKKFLVNERGTVRVPNYYMFEASIAYKVARLPLETLQELIVNPQTPFEEVQNLIDKLPANEGQNHRKDFKSSFKRNITSSSIGTNSNQDDYKVDPPSHAHGNGDPDLPDWFESDGIANARE